MALRIKLVVRYRDAAIDSSSAESSRSKMRRVALFAIRIIVFALRLAAFCQRSCTRVTRETLYVVATRTRSNLLSRVSSLSAFVALGWGLHNEVSNHRAKVSMRKSFVMARINNRESKHMTTYTQAFFQATSRNQDLRRVHLCLISPSRAREDFSSPKFPLLDAGRLHDGARSLPRLLGFPENDDNKRPLVEASSNGDFPSKVAQSPVGNEEAM